MHYHLLSIEIQISDLLLV